MHVEEIRFLVQLRLRNDISDMTPAFGLNVRVDVERVMCVVGTFSLHLLFAKKKTQSLSSYI